ncbi:MAG TPA: vWA domain-containing protein [Verrucomicrobiae bacterium]|nr:vWA domain-containing protein [Verrucomicrobiae bacterium]
MTGLVHPAAALTVRQRRKTIAAAAVLSVGLHAAVALGAAAWIVARYLAPAPAKFECRNMVRIEPEAREHSMALAEFEGAASAPAFNDRLTTSRLLEHGMPALPKLPVDQLMAVNPSSMIADSIAAMAGQGLAGLGTGVGAGGGNGDGMSFFGIQDTGRSVVIMIDVSGSMFLRLGDAAFGAVKEQATSLITGLGINSRFGIVVWSGGAGRWKEECVPATDATKAAATAFVRNDLGPDAYRRLGSICRDVLREGPGGTRHDLALRQAFAMRPEIIYMLSDGNALVEDTPIPTDDILGLTAQLQRSLPKEARLHTIYFMTGPNKPAERELLKSLAARNGGRFTDFDAKARK